jgi:hypothetical protein
MDIEDDDYGIPIGLPPELMPEIPIVRTWQQDVEAFFFANKSGRLFKPKRDTRR